MKKIKVIEYGIDDAGLLGVFAISVVEQPAIGVDFVALSEQHSVKFKEDFRGLLYGALLIPDQLIYRRDDKTEEEYYVKYSKDTIRAIAYNYLKQNMKLSNFIIASSNTIGYLKPKGMLMYRWCCY